MCIDSTLSRVTADMYGIDSLLNHTIVYLVGVESVRLTSRETDGSSRMIFLPQGTLLLGAKFSIFKIAAMLGARKNQ